MNKKNFVPNRNTYTGNECTEICKKYNISELDIVNILLENNYAHSKEIALLLETSDKKMKYSISEECFIHITTDISKDIIKKLNQSPNEYIHSRQNSLDSNEYLWNKQIFQFIFYVEYLKTNLSNGLLINEHTNDIIYSIETINILTERFKNKFAISFANIIFPYECLCLQSKRKKDDELIIRCPAEIEMFHKYLQYIPKVFLRDDDDDKINRISERIASNTRKDFFITKELDLFLRALQILALLWQKDFKHTCEHMPDFFMNYSKYYLNKVEGHIKIAQSLGAPSKHEIKMEFGKIYWDAYSACKERHHKARKIGIYAARTAYTKAVEYNNKNPKFKKMKKDQSDETYVDWGNFFHKHS